MALLNYLWVDSRPETVVPLKNSSGRQNEHENQKGTQIKPNLTKPKRKSKKNSYLRGAGRYKPVKMKGVELTCPVIPLGLAAKIKRPMSAKEK